MPQIGWLEILAIVIIAILVLGPKEFPIALKKIGSYFGKLKNTLSSFQRELNSVTEKIDIEKDIESQKENNQSYKDSKPEEHKDEIKRMEEREEGRDRYQQLFKNVPTKAISTRV